MKLNNQCTSKWVWSLSVPKNTKPASSSLTSAGITTLTSQAVPLTNYSQLQISQALKLLTSPTALISIYSIHPIAQELTTRLLMSVVVHAHLTRTKSRVLWQPILTITKSSHLTMWILIQPLMAVFLLSKYNKSVTAVLLKLKQLRLWPPPHQTAKLLTTQLNKGHKLVLSSLQTLSSNTSKPTSTFSDLFLWRLVYSSASSATNSSKLLFSSLLHLLARDSFSLSATLLSSLITLRPRWAGQCSQYAALLASSLASSPLSSKTSRVHVSPLGVVSSSVSSSTRQLYTQSARLGSSGQSMCHSRWFVSL